ncbi:actin filament-associated protein 1-like 2 isoform X2 [Ambystoma mexicanum]|uniref:actin filament-associated protein 1-like 2 isoform X2 n=1 Tax=Ambystoma mexicanum TaxID=8296 RepID=UPI0037E8094A
MEAPSQHPFLTQMDKFKALEQLLTELEDFLNILEKESLSSTAILKKCLLSEILQLCLSSSSGGDEEYIYMNKVDVNKRPELAQEKPNRVVDLLVASSLTNGELGQHASPPQKSLPDLPPPKIIQDKLTLSQTRCESVEGYYEEAEPYDPSVNEDGEPVSSSYESYDEEESSKGKTSSHQHQWPSTEASIELMKEAHICAFLWRKKWLGQWAKQLCVIKDTRLLCYKSSKDHSPQLDVNLLGCSVVHKEKQVRKKEHKLKITPTNTDVIVLGMQSKDQAEQWYKVIQEISSQQPSGGTEGNQYSSDTQRHCNSKAELSERYSAASESGSSTDGPPEMPEVKDVKKKGSSGLKLSNLMNLGRKKSSNTDSPERPLETATYLNVLINSQWKSRWCCLKNGKLHFYQDKNRSKSLSQPVDLSGCEVLPEPSPEHLYSFRILQNGEELATLEAKTSEEMGHWLGLLLSETGSKADPEEFTYDYVDADRVSCIVYAAKQSFYLMQRKFSEPNTYIENTPRAKKQQEDLYDDVEMNDQADLIPDEKLCTETLTEDDKAELYLELLPVRSFLHTHSTTLAGKEASGSASGSANLERFPSMRDVDGASEEVFLHQESEQCTRPQESADQRPPQKAGPEGYSSRPLVKIQAQQQNISFPQCSPERKIVTTAAASPQLSQASKDQTEKSKFSSTVSIENKLGKNRMEFDVKRLTEEKDVLEKEKEELRSRLALLRKERRELREAMAACKEKEILCSLEEKLREIDEESKIKECRRVDLELSMMEVKENLRKAESGPVTLGTAVDSIALEGTSPTVKSSGSPTHLSDSSPVNSATALKTRPMSIMAAGKGTVMQKAKEWERKGTS